MEDFLKGISDTPFRKIEELVKWNEDHSDRELPGGMSMEQK